MSNTSKTIIFGADHAGYQLKDALVARATEMGFEVADLGTNSDAAVDYTDFGFAVAQQVVAAPPDTLGVCVCGSGIGVAMAANKVDGVRAATVGDATSARLAREHNDANVMCVGARLVETQVALDAFEAFVATAFEGGRHQARVDKLDGARRPGGVAGGVAGGDPGAALTWSGNVDAEVEALLAAEVERQSTTLQLIASENFASPAVMAATGSVFTNKYAEGYPKRRYYGGNVHIDEAEQLAIDRAKQLFGAEHANVQPHSGSQANAAVYMALVDYGDTVLGMSLDHGGHLTHGSPVNSSGKLYNFVSYGVTETDERIDFDQVAQLAHHHRPKLLVAGATAYPRRIDPEPFRQIADEVGALFMFDAAHVAGLIAGGVHPNPTPLADVVTFTTHKTLRGARGGCILSTAELAKRIDSAVFPGIQGGPLEHAIAAKAVGFGEALQPSFAAYAQRIVDNAAALAEALAGQGFRLVSGGTENHLMLIDLQPFDAELTGKEAQEVLDRGGVTVNRNTIPNDPRSPFVTSGLRLGTASVSTQGMGAEQMAVIADVIARILRQRDDDAAVAKVRREVNELCAAFPPYGSTTR